MNAIKVPPVNPNTVLALGVGVLVVAWVLNKDELDVSDLPIPDQRQTLPDSVLASIAERIYAAFYSGDGLWENEVAMGSALLECRNNRDVYEVVQFYGVREGPYIGTGEYNLFGAFENALSNSQREALNDELSAKGITYRV